MVLALVGAPSRLTYEAYKALKASGGALGAVLGASEAAALGAIAAQTAAALGAGVGGFLIGQAILNGLEQPPVLPDMGEYCEAGNPQQSVRLVYDYFVDGVQIFSDQVSQFIIAPIKGMFFRVIAGSATWFVFDGNGLQQNLVSTTNTVSGTRFELKSFINGESQPIAPTKRLPSYLPKNPDRPKPALPTLVPFPGVLPLPITPTVVPNPGNDDPSENEERPPGVVVQIPQTGTQVRYEPGGVTISNYNAPNREPFRVPPLVLLPGATAATPPCCESEPPDLTEIICRLKALENGLLDDGFDFTVRSTPDAQSGKVLDPSKTFDVVNVFVSSRPSNLRIQNSTPPVANVWYVGWFSWLTNGKEGIRTPLHFQESAFIAPDGVEGFVYQLNSGCTGFAGYTTKVKRDYVDVC